MVRIRGPDKAVIPDIQKLPKSLDVNGHAIHEFLGRHPRLLRGALDLLAMLIHARQEEYIGSAHALVAGHGIGRHSRIRVADVKLAARIVDGCRDVVFSFRHKTSPLFLNNNARAGSN